MQHAAQSHLAIAPRLTVKQQHALEALLTGATDAEAAAKAGVSRETVCRWRRGHSGFVAAWNRARLEEWSAARQHLVRLYAKAVATIEAAMDAPTPSTRLRAASLVLRSLKASEDLVTPGAHAGPIHPAAVEAGWRRDEQLDDEARATAAVLDGMMVRAVREQ